MIQRYWVQYFNEGILVGTGEFESEELAQQAARGWKLDDPVNHSCALGPLVVQITDQSREEEGEYLTNDRQRQ